MRGGIFGWSLPPGVTTLPGEEPWQCGVCGNWDDDCVCPECPVCGYHGDQRCYQNHGMVMSNAQLVCLRFAAEREILDNQYWEKQWRETDEEAKKEKWLSKVEDYRLLYKKEPEIGGTVVHTAGAPGVGRWIYTITRIEDGIVYGLEKENNVWVPDGDFYK